MNIIGKIAVLQEDKSTRIIEYYVPTTKPFCYLCGNDQLRIGWQWEDNTSMSGSSCISCEIQWWKDIDSKKVDLFTEMIKKYLNENPEVGLEI